MPDHVPLPQTVAELHALVLEQQASIAKMQQEIAGPGARAPEGADRQAQAHALRS
jgi:hypothetical protein